MPPYVMPFHIMGFFAHHLLYGRLYFFITPTLDGLLLNEMISLCYDQKNETFHIKCENDKSKSYGAYLSWLFSHFSNNGVRRVANLHASIKKRRVGMDLWILLPYLKRPSDVYTLPNDCFRTNLVVYGEGKGLEIDLLMKIRPSFYFGPHPNFF